MTNTMTRPWRRWGAALATAGLAGSVAVAAAVPAQSAPLDALSDELVLHFDFGDPIDGGTIADKSGNGFDGTVNGDGATIVDGTLDLTSNTFVQFPGEVFEGNDTLTISTWLRNDMSTGGNYVALYFGKESNPPSQYWLLNPANPDGNIKSVFTDGLSAGDPWNTEAGNIGPASVDGFALYTTVITPTSITNYLDGQRTGSDDLSRTVTQFGDDLVAYIGTSPYREWGDPIWDGAMGDLKVYAVAMTDQQVAAQYFEELGDSAAAQAAVEEDAAALAVDSAATVHIELPTVGANGSEIVWTSTHPSVIAIDGTVSQPAVDTEVTLTADLTLAGATAQRSFDVLGAGDGSVPPVVHYRLDETSGTVAADSSGNGNDAAYVGEPTLQGDAGVRLDGTDDYVDLPDNLVTGIESVTVSVDVLIRNTQATPYFIWNIGNPATSASGTGYMMATGNAYRHTITPNNWSGEQNATSGQNLQRGVWKTITYTIDAGTAVTYLDGVEVGQSTTTTVTPGSIGGGMTTANYIGRSAYSADRLLAGSVRDFRLYDSALSAEQVLALVPTDSTRVLRDAAVLDLGDTSAVTSNLALPASGINGSIVTWSSSDEGTVRTDGTVIRPGTLEDDATVTLTATITRGDAQQVREFTVTVLAAVDEQSVAEAAVANLEVTNLGDVRGNLHLPAEIEGLPVTWKSDDEAIIASDGIVNRPQIDTEVTLTATVTNGDAIAERTFTAKVIAAIELAEFEGYGFSYFTGNSVNGEKIYFAASRGNDALQWDELNGGQPTLESEYGTLGLRDPFIIRSPEGDKFYMIATDLSIGRNGDWDASQRHGSQYLEVWESNDLVNWSDQRHVKVAPDNAGNLWAPEAYYDESIGEYVVFWASKLYPNNDRTLNGIPNEMLYSTTRDFVNFSEPQGWQTGISRIDSSVLEVDGVYHRFTKDEGAGTTGCSDIIHEYSDELRAPLSDWTMLASCIGRDAGTSAVEGPSIIKSNPGDVNGDWYYLFVDEYASGARGYIPLRTADITEPEWSLAPTYDMPASPRHGTVFPVTAEELAALRSQIDTADPVTSDEEGQVLRYDFESGAGTTVTDVTGNGYDGTIVGGGTLTEGALTFSGSNHVKLPDNVMAGLEDITIEAEVLLNSALSGNYFIYGLGNTDGGGAGDGYLFTTGNTQYRTSLATGNWSTEQTVGSGQALPRGEWVSLVYTLSGNTATLYLDGVQVGTGTVTANPGDIGGGFTTANHLGRSNYNADGLFRGQFREFAIWDRALSAEEVIAKSGQTDVLLGVTLEDDSVLKIDPIVDQNEHTVVFPVLPGTDLTALAPVFSTVEGVTSDPAPGTVVDLSSEVTYQLAGGSEATWAMSAVEMRSPVLPGLYADPNIIAFGDTYYIYATTDGYAGWGGKDFYTWKSKNLVDWERADEPFLTLDGENGNVPWATGNAWAPTAIERDGKYYFYFSGHNAQLDRKTIGVAVADHPEGPFVAEPEAMILNDEAVTSGQAIDPHAFHDPVSGKYYIYWGNGSPVMAELADDMVSLEPETIQGMPGLTSYREGTFMVYREGQYHATYSIDDTGSENYRVGYATSPTPEGPWTYRGVILEKDPSLGILGTGHNSIVNVPGTDDWYIAYHRFAIPGGNGTHRETTIDRLTFNEDTGLMETVTPTLSSVDPQEIEVTDPEPVLEFTDVSDALEHYESIMWLAERGISKGWTTPAGQEFRPYRSITRDAMAAFLYRHAGSPDVMLPAESPFIDVTPTNTEFYEEIIWLHNEDIAKGWETTRGMEFRPLKPITRDAMAAFLYRFAEEPAFSAPVVSPFEDITTRNTEFYTEITWLANTGIAKGWETSTGYEFRPLRSTSRDAMAAFLYRYDTLMD